MKKQEFGFPTFFIVFFLLKRSLYALFLVLLRDSAFEQLFIIIAVFVIYYGMQLVIQPFETKVDEYIGNIMEIFLLIIFFLLAAFLDKGMSEGSRTKLGLAIIILILLSLIMCIILNIIISVRAYCLKRKKKANENEQLKTAKTIRKIVKKGKTLKNFNERKIRKKLKNELVKSQTHPHLDSKSKKTRLHAIKEAPDEEEENMGDVEDMY